MEQLSVQPEEAISLREPNRLRTGLVAVAAAAGIACAPSSASAAEWSTDGSTTTSYDNDLGYDFRPGFVAPDPQEGILFPTVIHTSLPIEREAMPYAPAFSQSTEALRVGPSDVNVVLDRLDGLTGTFMGNITISVRGSASAEDNRYTADAGMQTPSKANVDLANERAEHFIDELQDQLHTSGNDKLATAEIVQEPGVEQVLDKKQVTKLHTYAKSHGYRDAGSMVVDYNTGAASAAVAERLDDVLATARGVYVRISGDVQIVPPLVHVTTKGHKPSGPESLAHKPAMTESGSFGKEFFMRDNSLISKEVIIGTSVAALAAGIRRRREEQNPLRAVPIEAPKRPQNPDEFEIVAS